MKLLMDKILRECVEQAYEEARLGRGRDIAARDRVFAEVLAELEIAGDAMRYVNSKGRIAWRATERLAIISRTCGWMQKPNSNMRMCKVLDRPSPNIAFSDEALRASLERLEGEWETLSEQPGSGRRIRLSDRRF